MIRVNIQGIGRDQLLEARWNRSQPAAFFSNNNVETPSFDLEKAKGQLSSDGYVDYICGRIIKTNIYMGDEVDPYLYDRDIGVGAFQEVVDSLVNS